jgi:hypothetical protein
MFSTSTSSKLPTSTIERSVERSIPTSQGRFAGNSRRNATSSDVAWQAEPVVTYPAETSYQGSHVGLFD